MGRRLSLLLVAAQLSALSLGAVSASPAGATERGRVASAPRGANASQARETRGRSVYAVASSNWHLPRTPSVRGGASVRRAARLAAIPLPSRPAWTPAVPLVLRI